jgi:hypothetical protein
MKSNDRAKRACVQKELARTDARAAAVPAQRIERRILLLRGEKVMLDADLAALYGVSTKVLNQAVKRNAGRFPADFMFRLHAEEDALLKFRNGTSRLRSQIVTSKRGGRRVPPYAITLAPPEGLEPPTRWLTATCSTD